MTKSAETFRQTRRYSPWCGKPCAEERLLQMTALRHQRLLNESALAPRLKHLVLVVDASSAMRIHRGSVLGLLQSLADSGYLPCGAAAFRVTLVVHGRHPTPLLVAQAAHSLATIREHHYDPGGASCVYDGVGLAIELVLERALGEKAAQDDVLFVILGGLVDDSSSRYGPASGAVLMRLSQMPLWRTHFILPFSHHVSIARQRGFLPDDGALTIPAKQNSAKTQSPLDFSTVLQWLQHPGFGGGAIPGCCGRRVFQNASEPVSSLIPA